MTRRARPWTTPRPAHLVTATRAAVAIGACVALAAPDALAYRPFDGTDASVVDRGELEIELGPVGWLHEGHEQAFVAPALVANVGVVERVELVAEAKDVVTTSPAHPSLEDDSVDAKVVVRRGGLQGQRGPSVAAEVGALLPSTSERGAGASLDVITSFVSDYAAVHVNVVGLVARSHDPGALASVIVEGPAAWPARPVGELLAARVGRETEASVLLGAIVPVREAVALDAGVRVGRAASGGLLGEVRLGVTFGISLWGRATTTRGGGGP